MGASSPNCITMGFGVLSPLVGSAASTMRSTTGLATGPPLVVISSVFDLESRATSAQRDDRVMLPMVMEYSAQEPSSTFFMSTTKGMPAGTPGPCALASDGRHRLIARARAKLRMGAPLGACLPQMLVKAQHHRRRAGRRHFADQIDIHSAGPQLAQRLVYTPDVVAFGGWFVAAKQGQAAVGGAIPDLRGHQAGQGRSHAYLQDHGRGFGGKGRDGPVEADLRSQACSSGIHWPVTVDSSSAWGARNSSGKSSRRKGSTTSSMIGEWTATWMGAGRHTTRAADSCSAHFAMASGRPLTRQRLGAFTHASATSPGSWGWSASGVCRTISAAPGAVACMSRPRW